MRHRRRYHRSPRRCGIKQMANAVNRHKQVWNPNPIEAFYYFVPPLLQFAKISPQAYLGAHRRQGAQWRWGVGHSRQGEMAAVPKSPVAMAATGDEPPMEVAPATAESPVASAAARLDASQRVERRRRASCVRSLYPLRIGGLLYGLMCACGTVWPSGLTAWPAPFAIVDAAALPRRQCIPCSSTVASHIQTFSCFAKFTQTLN